MKSLKNLNYPKQYIFIEDNDKKIYKTINVTEDSEQVDEYLWKPISTISQKYENDKLYYMIQHEDQRLGWVNLEKSIQILRFSPKTIRFIDTDFTTHEINNLMGVEKDFQAHFSNKIITTKSEITYNDETLISIFVKNKFFGFHPLKNFEMLNECDIKINKKDIAEKDFYKFSNLNQVFDGEINITDPFLIAYFKENGIGRVKINDKEYYWITLDGLEKYLGNIKHETKIVEENEFDKYLDDIYTSIRKERQQSKEIVQTVLSAKKYIQSKKSKEKDFRIKKLESSFKNAKIRLDEYKRIQSKNINEKNKRIKRLETSFKNAQTKLEEYKTSQSKKIKEKDLRIKRLESSFKNAQTKLEAYKNTNSFKISSNDAVESSSYNNKLKKQNKLLKEEILELKRGQRKLENSNKLSEERLSNQKEYNEKLESQKNKYKDRMIVVEEKMKKLLQKNDSQD